MAAGIDGAGVTFLLAAHSVRPAVETAAGGPVLAASVLDTLGSAAGGRREASVVHVRRALGATLVPGPATVWVSGERTDAPTAALLNGTTAHALDYDDVNDRMSGHPSAVLWPAILAVGEEVDASGAALAEAYTVGFDTIVAVAAALDVPAHYTRGWHATATIGTVGAAAAVSRLLGLDAAGTAHALGLASTTAAGSRQNFGTMAKPLHAGLAARNAVEAARFAAAGVTADPAELDGPLGFVARFGGAGPGAPRIVAELLDTPSLLAVEGLNIKSYPACYKVQRAVDAALAVLDGTPLRPEDVLSVRVTTEPEGQQPLVHHRPTDGTQAKFSMEYVVAAALLDGRIDLFSFADDRIARPGVDAVLRRVEPRTAPVPPVGPPTWEGGYATVEVETTTGVRTGRRDVPHGDHRDPLTWAEVVAKFDSCCRFGGTAFDPGALPAALAAAGAGTAGLPGARAVTATLQPAALTATATVTATATATA